MRIYLIRHGRQNSTLCNVDVALSKEGREQAVMVAERIAKYGIDAIYASTLIRAKETAEHIKQELVKRNQFPKEQPIEIRRDLREIDFGSLEGNENRDIPVLFSPIPYKVRHR